MYFPAISSLTLHGHAQRVQSHFSEHRHGDQKLLRVSHAAAAHKADARRQEGHVEAHRLTRPARQ